MGTTRLDVEKPANWRSLQPFHAPGTSRFSANIPKTNQGLHQSSAKLRVAWCKGKNVMLWEHSAHRTALDMCRILILTEGLAMLACVLAWDVAWHGFVEGWLWFCAIFWSGDLLLFITTGFHKNGIVRTTAQR